MPKLSHTIDVVNPNTKEKGSVVLEGIRFFRISIAREDLESYYRINFALMQYHKYGDGTRKYDGGRETFI